jgi:type I restriction enzyme R subunit
MLSPNFWFLGELDPLLFKCASEAERLVYFDPHAAVIKMRLFGEYAAKRIAAAANIALWGDESAIQVLEKLKKANALHLQAEQIFQMLRKEGNKAAHTLTGNTERAIQLLRMARLLAVWFHKAFSNDPAANLGEFQSPLNPAMIEAEQRAKLEDELEALRQELEATKAEQQAFDERNAQALEKAATAPPTTVVQFVTLLHDDAGQCISPNEAETRILIDEQLRSAGWDADTATLNYKSGARPQKGRSLAIAEWPTNNGWADYVLFAGLTPLAVVEAKRKNKDVSAALVQSMRYSKGYVAKDMDAPPKGGPWDGHVIPFLYSTNGRPFLKQLRTKSGIWFRDARVPTNLARPMTGWPTPAGLVDLLCQDIPAADTALADEAPNYLTLRDYQLEAVTAVEKAIAEGKREILVAMATGTGKTRTCIGLLYRLCKAGRFRRVLFLVDRTALGEQTADTLKDFRLEQHQSFPDIYDVKQLGDVQPHRETRLHIATIQGMIKRLLFPAEDATPPPVDQYDCVVVDECHRGYNLDREMSDTELSFRNESDYISQYSRVLDHFDAVRIGLTATPALHTTELFGAPVYTYSYRQAVIDGWLIDHEPPVRIVTALAEDGITWQKGETVEVVDGATGEVDAVHLPDELSVDIDDFNKRVITPSFNRVVCAALTEYIDPDLPGKTLIFCVTDSHADMVVDLLKTAFAAQYGSIADEAVVKITGQADRPLNLLRHFKNEQMPKVAVTVDLLTTGVDIPPIVNLVFIRRVRSRILYEQMLGRATRRCDEIGKEYFHIYDAVDMYSVIAPVSSMKPVAAGPNISFSRLLSELAEADTEPVVKTILDQFLAKFHRCKRHITGEALEAFTDLTGGDTNAFAKTIKSVSPTEAKRHVLAISKKADFGYLLDSLGGGSTHHLISNHEDSLRRIERGYGTSQKPQDYLDAFKTFLKDSCDAMPALLLVTQRPRELTRKQLREIKLLLDERGFSEAALQTAWRETTNQDIAASIIGFIRSMMLGSPLIPYEARVQRAMQRILGSRAWTDMQRKWLQRIGEQIRQEVIVDREAMEQGAFRTDGGFTRLNKIFNGQLESLLSEIYDHVWDDAA